MCCVGQNTPHQTLYTKFNYLNKLKVFIYFLWIYEYMVYKTIIGAPKIRIFYGAIQLLIFLASFLVSALCFFFFLIALSKVIALNFCLIFVINLFFLIALLQISSFNYIDSNSCRSFLLLEAIAKKISVTFR